MSSKLIVKSVVIEGLKTNYATIGKGKTLLVLPPWRTDIERFEEALDFLSENFKVYFLNVPGYGNELDFNKPYTLENYAEFILEWIKKLDLKEVTLLGISMAGPIAYYLLKSKEAYRFKKVIFLSPWYNLDCVKYPIFLKNFLIRFTKFLSKESVLPLMKKIYWNETLMLIYMWFITPKENYKDMENMRRYVRNFRNFSIQATFESIYYTLKADLGSQDIKVPVKAILIMSKRENQLDYDKTVKGYERLFSNMIELPMTHKFHAPRTWITKKMIKDYFGKAFEEAIKL